MRRFNLMGRLWFRLAMAAQMLWCCPRVLAFAASSSFDQCGFQAWPSDDGLPDNKVGAIAQTHDGFLWAGTRRRGGSTDVLPNKFDYA